jgi:hypothetical protein
VTSKSSSTRALTPEELKVTCPIIAMMHSLNLIGLSAMRVTRDAEGRIGYIITIYERFRSTKDYMGRPK